jgi:hypothetical protein
MMHTWWITLALVLGVASAVYGQATCTKVKANTRNAGQCMTVSASPITVMDANVSRCTSLIINTSANAIMCRDVTNDGIPSATEGIPVPAGQSLTLLFEGQGRWQCIRQAAADGTACVAEGLP